jgi:hypothetical protein
MVKLSFVTSLDASVENDTFTALEAVCCAAVSSSVVAGVSVSLAAFTTQRNFLAVLFLVLVFLKVTFTTVLS